MVLQVNGQLYGGGDDEPSAFPPGTMFFPVPSTPQTSSTTVFGNDAPPISVNFSSDLSPNFVITPEQQPYYSVSAGINFDRIAEVDDDGRGTLYPHCR